MSDDDSTGNPELSRTECVEALGDRLFELYGEIDVYESEDDLRRDAEELFDAAFHSIVYDVSDGHRGRVIVDLDD